MSRLGVFGGTFDPIHFGHLFVAEAVAAHARLDAVLFVPVAHPAHREAVASPADRRSMVALAIDGNPRFELDDTAMQQPGPAFTADTLARLQERRPGDRFSFIAGADSLASGAWRRLEEVAARLERFYLVDREGVQLRDVEAALAGLETAQRSIFERVQLPLMDVSSSLIRERIAAGQPIKYLTPDAVCDYIERRAPFAPVKA